MAGDWIKMRLDLADDPAVMEMAEQLGMPEQCVVGYLHTIWSWASRNSYDGSVTGVALSSLGRATRCERVPELMVQVGWLEVYETEDGRPLLVFPKWGNHLSDSAKSRALAALRMAKSRCAVSATETQPEKRREEKRRVKKDSTNVESPPKQVWDGDRFPLTGGSLYRLPMDLYDQYQATYPWDIDSELRKCAQWCRENKPKRSKSARGMQTRITKWLNRVDDGRANDNGQSDAAAIAKLFQELPDE